MIWIRLRSIIGVLRIFTDISKAFDCISHEVLLAKLHVYGSNTILVTFMHAYLNQRRQTKVGLLLVNS